MKKIFVDSAALRRLLTALVGQPHHIRELQATRDRPPVMIGNPIDVLIKEYDTQTVGATPVAETEFSSKRDQRRRSACAAQVASAS